MARWAIGHYNDKGSMNGMIDAKAVTSKVAGAMLDATHWRNAGVQYGCFSESGEWAIVYPYERVLVLCHVILQHNNGLQAIMTLLMVTQDNDDIQRRDPWPRHFLNLGCIEGQIVQVKH